VIELLRSKLASAEKEIERLKTVAEAREQGLRDQINSLSKEVARMHDALARDFALMVKLS
jgi:uncharacterized protein involved in exopolysaccharide biosynthesis